MYISTHGSVLEIVYTYLRSTYSHISKNFFAIRMYSFENESTYVNICISYIFYFKYLT